MRKMISAILAGVLFSSVGVENAAAGDGLFMVGVAQSRPDRKGDKYSFAAETETRITTNDGVMTRTSREEFDLEILEVRRDGLRLAYTYTGGSVGDPAADPNGGAMSRAWVGVRVVFDTDPHGEPRSILNWPEAKSKILAGLKREAPDATEYYDGLKAYLDEMPTQKLVREAVGDKLLALSGMQPRGVLTPGRTEFEPEVHPQPGGKTVKVVRTMDVSLLAEGACRAKIERVTRTDNRGSGDPESSLETTATVSTYDCWVVDLSEVNTFRRPDIGAEQVKSLKIRRTSGPGCSAG